MRRVYVGPQQSKGASDKKDTMQQEVALAGAVAMPSRKRSLTQLHPDVNSITSSSKESAKTPALQDWGPAEHRHFVAAVFELGMQHASPNVVMEKMTMMEESVNAERLKSKLQKYRKRKSMSKESFLQEYDWWLRGATGAREQGFVIPSVVASAPEAADPASTLRGGHRAAFLSYCSMFVDNAKSPVALPEPARKARTEASSTGAVHPRQAPRSLYTPASSSDTRRSGEPFQVVGVSQFARIPRPNLSPEEAQTPLGLSIVEMMRLLDSYSRHILMQRAKRSISKIQINGSKSPVENSSTNKKSFVRQSSSADHSKGSSDDGDSKAVASQNESMSLSSWGSDDRNQMQQALASSGEAEDLDLLFRDTT